MEASVEVFHIILETEVSNMGGVGQDERPFKRRLTSTSKRGKVDRFTITMGMRYTLGVIVVGHVSVISVSSERDSLLMSLESSLGPKALVMSVVAEEFVTDVFSHEEMWRSAWV